MGREKELGEIKSNPIPGYSQYCATKCGKIFNLKTNKYLKESKQSCGYRQVALNKKLFYVHRLVALAYIDNPENKPCVNHIDGNKTNNSVTNLEWCTYSENNSHAFKISLKSLKGEKHNQSKLKEEDVLKIRKLLMNGVLQKDIAKKYGVGRKCINDINTRKNWSHI